MVADAFSMFDYGGSFGVTGVISWCAVSVVLFLGLAGVDLFVVGNRLTVLLKKLMENYVGSELSKGCELDGFDLFSASLLVYLSFVGVFSVFPYVFCVSAHFSHNFSVSVVVWFATVFLGMSSGLGRFLSLFVPSGLMWYEAVPVSFFELTGVVSRLVSLGARLTMNMIAGKLLMCVGSSFAASMVSGLSLSMGSFFFFFFLMVLTGWEMVVGVVQAYIFVFLVAVYASESSMVIKR